MLIGVGGLGSVLLELLAREDWLGHIVVCGRDTRRGTARCNLAILGALAQGCHPSIEFVQLDLNDIDQTAEVIQRLAPDLILSTATLQTWWLPDLLPKQRAAEIHRAGFGMWLPVHLTLTLKLMRAVKESGYAGITLTAPFPDVVNNVLDKLDLAPTCGIGNLDEIVPKVRLLAAKRLGAPLEAVRATMVGHHALGSAVYGNPSDELPPYFLRVELGGKDVTDELNGGSLLRAAFPVTDGAATHFLTAGSTVRLVKAFFSQSGDFLHAPAPNGLPGGYPVIVSDRGVQVAPIDGLTLEQAIAINEASHRFDGIERIEPDGSVIFVPQSAQIFRDVLGYDGNHLSPDDSEPRAHELMARFRDYAGKHGVDLPRVST
jgi:hypothetical protein